MSEEILPLFLSQKKSHIPGVPRGDESVAAEPYLPRMVNFMLAEVV